MNTKYDIVIIGGGPAGLTAGLYATRARLSVLLVDKEMGGGGMITKASHVDNYPGFPDGISGFKLGELMQRQAVKFGLKIIAAEVTAIELKQGGEVIKTSEGNFTARAVIIASGSERQKLGVPGENKFTGRGVSYCATCDAPFFNDKAVAVIGGGDAAIDEAMHLAKVASRVTVLHRRDQLRATAVLQEKAFAEPKIEFLWNSVVEAIEGNDFVERLRLRNVKSGEKSVLEVAGVFVSVGVKPNTVYLKGVLPLDATNHIITNEKMETEIAGIFAAGDIRANSIRQAITAAGDGATAAIYAGKFISD